LTDVLPAPDASDPQPETKKAAAQSEADTSRHRSLPQLKGFLPLTFFSGFIFSFINSNLPE
jgi:hypothetical protein